MNESYTRPEPIKEKHFEEKERIEKEDETNPFKEWRQDFINKLNNECLPF